MILVEYLCASCTCVTETLATWPFPSNQPCSQCGTAARRVYSTAGLQRSSGSGAPPRASQPDHGDRCPSDVPGGCALPPVVAAVWAARVRGDAKALKSAMLKQEQFLERTKQTPDQLAETTRKPPDVFRPLNAQKSE